MFKKSEASPQTPEMPAQNQVANAVAAKPKKPIFKKWWFWVIVVIVIAALAGGGSSFGSGGSGTSKTSGKLTIVDGTAKPANPTKGTEVTITAEDAAEGKVFDAWVVQTGDVSFANALVPSTTFTMPDGEASIAATYRDADPTTNEGTETYKKYPISNTYLSSDSYNVFAYVNGTLVNSTDKDLSYISVEFSCYAEDGSLLGTAYDSVTNLGAGKTWNFEASCLFSGGKSAIASYEFADLTAY